ncbi:hypothetical protein PO909_005015, partial [Leuciscus waleckii]
WNHCRFVEDEVCVGRTLWDCTCNAGYYNQFTRISLHLLSLDGLPDDSVTGNCSQFDSCDGCISGDPALNLTRCVWQSCNDGKRTHVAYEFECILRCNVSVVYAHIHTEDPSDGHAIRATESELRECVDMYVLSIIAADGGSADGGGKDTTSPEFSQASFDLSSFIGGIILVLVLQAGAFFAMRFLKTKDSTYETM